MPVLSQWCPFEFGGVLLEDFCSSSSAPAVPDASPGVESADGALDFTSEAVSP